MHKSNSTAPSSAIRRLASRLRRRSRPEPAPEPAPPPAAPPSRLRPQPEDDASVYPLF
ncbi:hypothetical protein ACQEU8_21235 [Streptomyces sp. CA-250714]|uniref:hypothetical protein n=1 Tax=Streptomyces sp. CA-250714 TaxID=3240060 RepID=UPI003D934F56